MSHDLSDLWIRNEITRQIRMVAELEKALDSLKNKEGSYARGMTRMINVRNEIIKLLKQGKQGVTCLK